jgi:hypothetical protein
MSLSFQLRTLLALFVRFLYKAHLMQRNLILDLEIRGGIRGQISTIIDLKLEEETKSKEDFNVGLKFKLH